MNFASPDTRALLRLALEAASLRVAAVDRSGAPIANALGDPQAQADPRKRLWANFAPLRTLHGEVFGTIEIAQMAAEPPDSGLPPFALATLDRRIVYANAAALRLMRRVEGAVPPVPQLCSLFPEDEAAFLTEKVLPAIAEGPGRPGGEYFRSRTGLVAFPIRDDSGNLLMLAAADPSIERLGVSRLTAQSRDRAILDAIPDLIFVLDREGVFLDYQPGKTTPPHLPPENFLGRNIADVLPMEVAGPALRFVKEAVRTREVQTFEYVLTDPHTGEPRNFSARLSVDRHDRVIVVAQDITAHVELEHQLMQSRKLESVGRLAGGIAHDFNNLLTVVNGYSDFLLSGGETDESTRSALAAIRQAGEMGVDLVRQLLAFSRKQPIERRLIDINQAIREIRQMLHRLVGEDVEILFRLSDDAGAVLADAGLLHQVLLNLSANARDAMPGRGTITIETARAAIDGNHMAGVPPGEYAILTVSDTGRGMDEATMEQIFEPFFTTKGERGSGLGLATVYGIVRQCEGSIRVESTPGRGTRFTILLPRVAAMPATRAAVPSDEEPGGTETVLVAEDQDGVRKLVSHILRSKGYTVLEASSAVDATMRAAAHDGPIHLLLTDIVMPDMTGKELADNLKPLRPDMRVLYMSGYSEADVSRRGIDNVNAEYIAKPFAWGQLLRKVRDVLSPHTRAVGAAAGL